MGSFLADFEKSASWISESLQRCRQETAQAAAEAALGLRDEADGNLSR